MKIAYVIGHTKSKKGAYSKYFDVREFDFWKALEFELNLSGDVFYHNNLIPSYTLRQKYMAQKTKGYDIVFELHFNSSNGSASGCEAFYFYKNDYTKNVCEKFCNEYTRISGSINRGAKPFYSPKQRGYTFIKEQKTNAILLEPFFGDNEKDCKNFSYRAFVLALKKCIDS